MKIQDAEFVKAVSINDKKIFFDPRSEVVFVGRSNVGKSSLMNALMHKKDLVKTSSKPGKTRSANIFLVNQKYYFTDLPGYGFAKLGQDLREDLDALISWYLEERKPYIKQVFVLIDTKIGPQQSDIDMIDYLTELQIPHSIILSKTDRLSNNDVNKSLQHTQNLIFGSRVIPVSAQKKQGIDALRKVVGESLK